MNKIEQLKSDIEKIEKGLKSPTTPEQFKDGLRKIVKEKKDELESLMKAEKKEPKKEEPKKQEVKKVEPVKKEAPEKKSSGKSSQQILDDCREILSRHNKQKKSAVQRIKERKKQGKPATLTPSETVSKTAKSVKSKVIEMKDKTDKGLPVSEVNKLSSGIVATVKSTLSGIKNNVEKQKFITHLISEIRSLGSGLTKVAMQGGLFEDGGMMANGGEVDEELIRASAKSIYDHFGGMMELRNKFLQLANTDEKYGDIETANLRRKIVKEYQDKQPKMMADGGMFEQGGRYNTGRSWTLDHNQHNKSESYEVSKSDRKYEGGGGIDLLADMSGAELHNVGGTSFSNVDLTPQMDITHPMFEDGGNVGLLHDGFQIYGTDESGWYAKDIIKNMWIKPINKQVWESEMEVYDAINTNQYKYQFAQGGRYNTGRSWTLDRNQHNKSESYELPKSERKFGAGGINMGEYFEKKKYSYEEGGDIADSNTEMLMSKIRELQHHTSEIQKLVNSNTKVEAWVVAKAERSATDLSDITHYIDGKKSIDENKFADGGRLASVEVIFENPEYNYSTSVNPNATEQEIRKYFVGNMFDMGVYPSENFQKVIDIKYKPNNNYAHGGLTEHGLQIGDKIVDKSNYSQNSIQVMNDGRYAMVDLDKGERIEGIYADGGGVDAFKKGDKVILKFDIEYRKGNEVVYEVVGFDNDLLILENPNRVGGKSRKVQMRSYVSPNDVVLYSKYADGGSIPNNYRGRTTEDIWNSLTENQRVHFLYDHFDELGTNESELVRLANKEFKDLNEDVQDAFKTHTLMGQYADGGRISGSEYDTIIKSKGLFSDNSSLLNFTKSEINSIDNLIKSIKNDNGYYYSYSQKNGSLVIDNSKKSDRWRFYKFNDIILVIHTYDNGKYSDYWSLKNFNELINFIKNRPYLIGAFKMADGGYMADGGVSDEKLYKIVGKKNGQLVEINELPMTYEDSKKFIKEQGIENYYQNVDIVSYHGNKPRFKYADGGMINYKKIKRIGEDEKYGFKYIVREEGDNYVIVEDEKIELWEKSSPMDRKMYYEDLLPKEEVDNEFKHFADGGVMANGGEIEYRVEYEVFVDDADDPYTDNRTKTFKDLDQAIEFAKRVYASVDYEIIKDGEVVEYGYVDTTNKKLSKFADGGETDDDMGVQFIDYKDKMIMYEPHYKEYYTNDIQFDSLEKAKKYIDDGSKMTPAQINLYRRGAMANGGIMEKGERIGDKGEVKYGDLVVGNDYFQVKRPDLGIEKIKITEKENGRYKYKKDTDNYTDEIVAVKYQGRYTDNEKLYGIFEDKDEAKQMAIKLLIERMNKYADGGMMADGGSLNKYYIRWDSINSRGGVNRNNKELSELPKNIVVNQSNYVFIKKDTINGKDYVPVRIIGGFKGVQLSEQEIKDKKIKRIETMEFADGGKTPNRTELNKFIFKIIRNNANALYNKKGMRALKNSFSKLADQYEKNGDIKTANFTRKLVKEYENKNMADGGIMAKGGMVVTSIKDIPNFKQRLDEGKITYRGLGTGKLYNDFYDIAGESGTMIKVDGKEYYITDTEFNTFSRGSDGKLRIKFDAPQRKGYAKGGILDVKVGSILIYQTRNDKKFGVKGQYWKVISIEGDIAKLKMSDIKGNLINENLPSSNGQINLKELEDTDYSENWKVKKLANGGTTTFNDKAKAIAQSLLKRKKVAPSVQKDYGKTYDKKEAIESAKRIAGAIRKKELAKKKS